MSFYDSLPVLLRTAYLAFHRNAQSLFSGAGVTVDQFVVLCFLATEDNLTQKQLCERTGSDSSTLGAMLKLLERDGLVRRDPDPEDGRALRVRLTPKGRKKQQTLEKLARPLRQRLEQAVSADTRDDLREGLRGIAAAMQKSK